MGENAYFQIVHKTNRTFLKVFPASQDGEMFQIDEVIRYLDRINFPDYDSVALNQYLKRADFQKEFRLLDQEILPENERCFIDIYDEGEKAVARFYPPSSNGKKLTKEDILSDLKFEGVVHGILEDVVDEFIKAPEYCRNYVVAKATPPVQGHDAVVEYHFDINATAKPKLNDDGSVDFHHLGNIKPVQVGEKLATLTPADFGKPGVSVTGKSLSPNKVAVKRLRHGRNITMTEDGRELYSQVAGHVTLVDDLVMVSNIYDVPANVDASTGDIEYKGTVNVVGNVNTGYVIKADGDIIVNGVVEGADLIAGGNIVLKRGMQGMSRGTLTAEGNVTAKFIENSQIKCKGTLMCDAVLHSDVECQGEIAVLGKKGLINGGHIRSYANIAATQLGSSMGTSTVVEVLPDIGLVKLLNETEEKTEEACAALKKMDGVLHSIKKCVKTGKSLSPKQKEYLKTASASKPKIQKKIESMKAQCETLRKSLKANSNVSIRVEGVVNSGVQIVIKDVSKIMSDRVSRCKFVREGADIKSIGI